MKLSDRFDALDATRSPDLWSSIENREPRPPPPAGTGGRRSAAAIVALVVAAGAIALAARAFIGMEAREPGATASVQPKANGVIWFRVGGGDGPSFVYEIRPDGSGQRLVFDSQPPRFSQIAWSPDGTRIAFVDPVVERRGIYVSNPDGTEAQRLTDGVNDGWPSWSPDGTRIAFSSTRYDPGIGTCEAGSDLHCRTDIYTVNADGGNVTRLTTDPFADYQPVWSPEGFRIAFVKAFNGTATAVYSMDADGTDVSPVSSHKDGRDFSPSWSPDGAQVVFAAIRNEEWGIWVVNADGTDEHAIVGPGRYVNDPVWSPDGALIAFVGNPSTLDYSPDDAVYVMRPDGSDIELLSNRNLDTYGVAGDIAWQPVSTGLPATPAPRAPRVTAVVDLPGYAPSAIYGEGSLWVAVSNGDGTNAGQLLRLDPGTGETVAEIPVPAVPTWEVGGGGLAVGDGSVWIAGTSDASAGGGRIDAHLVRVDAATGRVVASIDLGGMSGADVAVDGNGVWVLIFADNNTMELVRIDPSTDAVAARTPIPASYGHYVFARGGNVVVAANEVSGQTIGNAVLFLVDPSANRIIGKVPLASPAWPAMDEQGIVWVATGDHLLTVDPATLNVYADVKLRSTGDALAAGDGGIWFFDPVDRSAVHRYEPKAGLVDASVELPREASTPIALAVSPDAVWVLDYRHKLVRIAAG